MSRDFSASSSDSGGLEWVVVAANVLLQISSLFSELTGRSQSRSCLLALLHRNALGVSPVGGVLEDVAWKRETSDHHFSGTSNHSCRSSQSGRECSF